MAAEKEKRRRGLAPGRREFKSVAVVFVCVPFGIVKAGTARSLRHLLRTRHAPPSPSPLA